MRQLHESVGGYEADLASIVARTMAKLPMGAAVCRSNWSLSFTGQLGNHPDRYLLNPAKRRRNFPDVVDDEWSGVDGAIRRLDIFGAAECMFTKVEYQTLRRLPNHPEFVLFTVRVFTEPFHLGRISKPI